MGPIQIDEMISHAALEYAETLPEMDFDAAKTGVCRFIGADTTDGLTQIRIKGVKVTDVRSGNIFRNMRFLDLVEITVESGEIAGAFAIANPFLVTLGGIFLWRKVRDLTKVELQWIHSLCVIALYRAAGRGQCSMQHWHDAFTSLDLVELPVKVSSIEIDGLAKLAENLATMKLVRESDGMWEFRDEPLVESEE